jgi:hypothetical protein
MVLLKKVFRSGCRKERGQTLATQLHNTLYAAASQEASTMLCDPARRATFCALTVAHEGVLHLASSLVLGTSSTIVWLMALSIVG